MKKTLFFSIILLFIALNSFSQAGFTQEGLASVYPENHEGKSTASGEKYSFRKATCAHLNLPFGTLVKVINLENNLSVVLRVNDRGPFVPDRIVQVSKSAAEKLAFGNSGVAKVKIEVVEEDGKAVVMPIAVTNPNGNETLVKESVKPDSSVKPVIKPVETPNEFYKLDISKFDLTGFTIQIGSFKELANLLKISGDAKSNLKTEVFVQVSSINNEKVYKLYIGRFPSKIEAEKEKEKVAKLFPGSFIVELKK